MATWPWPEQDRQGGVVVADARGEGRRLMQWVEAAEGNTSEARGDRGEALPGAGSGRALAVLEEERGDRSG